MLSKSWKLSPLWCKYHPTKPRTYPSFTIKVTKSIWMFTPQMHLIDSRGSWKLYPRPPHRFLLWPWTSVLLQFRTWIKKDTTFDDFIPISSTTSFMNLKKRSFRKLQFSEPQDPHRSHTKPMTRSKTFFSSPVIDCKNKTLQFGIMSCPTPDSSTLFWCRHRTKKWKHNPPNQWPCCHSLCRLVLLFAHTLNNICLVYFSSGVLLFISFRHRLVYLS